jgi:hypothetical protein
LGRLLFVLGLLVAVLAAAPGVGRELPKSGDAGWLVIVASVKLAELGLSNGEAHEAIGAKVGECGLTATNEFSSKFFGFRRGFNVYFVAFEPAKADALGVLEHVQTCVSDAYVKWGRYVGL